MRTERASTADDHWGLMGCLISRMPAWRGVRFPLRPLQLTQASTQLAQDVFPPRERGTMWSIVSCRTPGITPQYWQRN